MTIPNRHKERGLEMRFGLHWVTYRDAGCPYAAQCLELDVASQGETEAEALENLKEALELYFEPPQATRPPEIRLIDVEVGAP